MLNDLVPLGGSSDVMKENNKLMFVLDNMLDCLTTCQKMTVLLECFTIYRLCVCMGGLWWGLLIRALDNKNTCIIWTFDIGPKESLSI